MTNFNWNTIFTLPENALAGDRRITKEALLRNASLSPSDQRLLKKIKSLTHFAVVQKTTTRIPVFVNAERDIQSVIFLRCELINSAANCELARVLHTCFPNPTVIIFEYHSEAHISAAITRRSRTKIGTNIIDTIDSTQAFTLGAQQAKSFLDSLRLNALSQTNLHDYVRNIAWNIKLFNASLSLGFFPTCPYHRHKELQVLIDRIIELSSRIETSLHTRHIKRDLTLDQTTRMRVQEHSLSEQLNEVAERIKEISNG